MKNKISIIVPIYNMEKYLKICIVSLMHQTYQNIEIILVDDGSTDTSGEICDYYSKQDTRIKTIHQKNKGVAAARNCGVSVATGEFIGFVDPDDWIEETMYEEMMEVLRKNKADICMCDFVYEYDGVTEDVTRKKPLLKSEIFTGEDAIHRLFLNNTFFYTMLWNKLFKRTLWMGIRFPEGYVHEDEAVIHRVYGKCDKIATISKNLYHYRQVPSSITHTNQIQRRFDFCYALADRIDYLKHGDYKEECMNLTEIIVYQVLNNYYISGIEKKYLKRGKKEVMSVMPLVMKDKTKKFKYKLSILIFGISPLFYKKLFFRKE